MKYRQYRGMEVVKVLSPAQRKALKLWRRAVLTVYKPDMVDAKFAEEQILLTAKTENYIYSDFTPLKIKYKKGSRPYLEEIAAKVTKNCKGERKTMLALMRWVRDIHKRHTGPYKEAFHGGTEEEVIKKGSDMCNEMARVLIFLCQICGLPGRFVGHPMGGHGVTEIHVEGGWAYVDDRGKYFEKADGTLASTWDIMQDPSIIDKQPAHVRKDLARTKGLKSTREKFFHPNEITTVANYNIDNCAHYSYEWVWNTPAVHRSTEGIKRELRKAVKKVFI
ncbi:transglutaminase family protein [Planctomycetota bacterium]